MLTEAREEALNRMEDAAVELGADAIVNVSSTGSRWSHDDQGWLPPSSRQLELTRAQRV